MNRLLADKREEVRQAAELIRQFTSDRDLQDYLDDALLRSGVERQFGIIDDALNRLAGFDPATASRISGLQQIIPFRNVLIHGYDIVDDRVVWEAVHDKLPTLHDEAKALLRQGDNEQ